MANVPVRQDRAYIGGGVLSCIRGCEVGVDVVGVLVEVAIQADGALAVRLARSPRESQMIRGVEKERLVARTVSPCFGLPTASRGNSGRGGRGRGLALFCRGSARGSLRRRRTLATDGALFHGHDENVQTLAEEGMQTSVGMEVGAMCRAGAQTESAQEEAEGWVGLGRGWGGGMECTAIGTATGKRGGRA